MIEVPLEGLLDPYLKGRFRIPTQIVLNFLRINAITSIMPFAVLYVFDEMFSNLTVYMFLEIFQDRFYNGNIWSFIMPADVITSPSLP